MLHELQTLIVDRNNVEKPNLSENLAEDLVLTHRWNSQPRDEECFHLSKKFAYCVVPEEVRNFGT